MLYIDEKVDSELMYLCTHAFYQQLFRFKALSSQNVYLNRITIHREHYQTVKIDQYSRNLVS